MIYIVNTKDDGTTPPPQPGSSSSSSSPRRLAGLGFFTASTDMQRPANVLESAAFKLPPPPYCAPTNTTFMATTATPATKRREPDEFDEIINDNYKDSCSSRLRKAEAEAGRRKPKKFPPPISSLSQHGKPTFFLQSVRKDGRLELRQVKSNRPETLLASREDGRFRLHLIYNDHDQDTPEQSDQEAEDTITEEEEEEEEEEERVTEWKFPVTPNGGGGDGSRRCYGRTSLHQCALLAWRQPYVSIN